MTKREAEKLISEAFAAVHALPEQDRVSTLDGIAVAAVGSLIHMGQSLVAESIASEIRYRLEREMVSA